MYTLFIIYGTVVIPDKDIIRNKKKCYDRFNLINLFLLCINGNKLNVDPITDLTLE